MKKYIVKLVFSVETETRTVDQVDEQWRVVLAESLSGARKKSDQIGLSESETLKRSNGEFINWRFVTTIDIVELSNLNDGDTIFTYTPEIHDSKLYINQVLLRSSREIELVR